MVHIKREHTPPASDGRSLVEPLTTPEPPSRTDQALYQPPVSPGTPTRGRRGGLRPRATLTKRKYESDEEWEEDTAGGQDADVDAMDEDEHDDEEEEVKPARQKKKTGKSPGKSVAVPPASKKSKTATSHHVKREDPGHDVKAESSMQSTSRAPANDDADADDAAESDDGFALATLPSEILDKILGDPVLNLRDHLALAATCKLLRTCYYTPITSSCKAKDIRSGLWRAITLLRPPPNANGRHLSKRKVADKDAVLLKSIWSNRVALEDMHVLWPETVEVEKNVGRGKIRRLEKVEVEVDEHLVDQVVRSTEWENGMALLAKCLITKTRALEHYQLDASELDFCRVIEMDNPHGGAKMKLYWEAVIESIALEFHGGPIELARVMADAADEADNFGSSGGSGNNQRYRTNRARYGW